MTLSLPRMTRKGLVHRGRGEGIKTSRKQKLWVWLYPGSQEPKLEANLYFTVFSLRLPWLHHNSKGLGERKLKRWLSW